MECDLAMLGIDYRDYWRPGHGRSQLTLRRLLLIVEGLQDRPSRFWAAITDGEPLGPNGIILADIFKAVANRPHPLSHRRQLISERREKAEKKALILKARRQRRRLKRRLMR